jgi:DNA invertase Pin-like site-specific DNA recombinase
MPLLDRKLYSRFSFTNSFMDGDEERNRIRKRQREGINMAIINRTKFGRSKIRISEKFVEVYNQWKKGQITVVKAMQELGVKKTTYYKLVKEYEIRFQ